MKHLLKFTATPAALALALLIGGTPSAPIAGLLPTVGGCAFANAPVPPGGNDPIYACSSGYGYYDNDADQYSWVGNIHAWGGFDSKCYNCTALAEYADDYQVRAYANGAVALVAAFVPKAQLAAAVFGSIALYHQVGAWYLRRVARRAGC